eukprot:5694362-Pleurochrysis_carterae.AAC.1
MHHISQLRQEENRQWRQQLSAEEQIAFGLRSISLAAGGALNSVRTRACCEIQTRRNGLSQFSWFRSRVFAKGRALGRPGAAVFDAHFYRHSVLQAKRLLQLAQRPRDQREKRAELRE